MTRLQENAVRPHRLDLVSLLSGLPLVGVGLAVLLGRDLTNVPWAQLSPAVLLAGGAVVLVSAVRRGR